MAELVILMCLYTAPKAAAQCTEPRPILTYETVEECQRSLRNGQVRLGTAVGYCRKRP